MPLQRSTRIISEPELWDYNPGMPNDMQHHVRLRGPTIWLLVVLTGSVLYAVTAQRTVSWQDSGEFQLRVLQGDLTGAMGLARAHPLYIAAGWALTAPFPATVQPMLLNVFSGLGMAVASANLALAVRLLAGRWWPGLLAGALLGLCHTAWWLGTIAEVYTWSLAGLTAEMAMLAALLQRPNPKLLAGLALVNGLGLCVHNFALLGLPVYATVAVVLVAKKRLPWRALLLGGAAWLVGAGLFVGLAVAEAMRIGVLDAIRSALTGGYAGKVFNIAAASRHAAENWLLTAMNFANPLLPLACLGWVALWRSGNRLLAGGVTAVTLIEVVFFARYNVPDQFTFVLPSLAMIALAAGVGLDALARRDRGRKIAVVVVGLLSLVIQPIFYAAAPSLAQRVRGPAPARQPFRDEYRYWLVPWKHDEDSAERFVLAAWRQTPDDAILHADSTSYYPLAWQQVVTDSTRLIVTPHPTTGVRIEAEPPTSRPTFATKPSALPAFLREYALPPRPGEVLYRLPDTAEEAMRRKLDLDYPPPRPTLPARKTPLPRASGWPTSPKKSGISIRISCSPRISRPIRPRPWGIPSRWPADSPNRRTCRD